MLLAIIMETYAGVKSGASNTLTLLSQAASMVKRQREAKLGQQITHDQILEAADSYEDECEISAEALIRRIDEMPIGQADEIVERCRGKLKTNILSAGTVDVLD